jgi:hypothetical protein
MSGTGPDRPAADFESSEAHRYFRELEEFFIDLRGAPLQLSPADWQVSKRWYERGIPLEHVKHVLADVFTRRRERGAEGLVTLRYVNKPVEASWKDVEEMRATGERAPAPRFDAAARLAALAAALPAALPGRDELAARITALAGDTEHVEAALSALDKELLARAEGGLDEEARDAVERQVEETVAGLFGRLFAGDVEKARGRLHRQVLRRQLGLPVLSLFSPEAERGEAAESGEPSP